MFADKAEVSANKNELVRFGFSKNFIPKNVQIINECMKIISLLL